MTTPQRPSATKGFTRASQLLATRIRVAGESRGFAVSRLLTHWEEVVGEAIAKVAQPTGISYGREGLGATLTVLVPGPHAPMVEMQKDRIRDKVNACYGYRAIVRVRITQTAPQGFAEAQAAFGAAPASAAAPPPEVEAKAAEVAADVENTELRLALAALAANVLSRNR
jgi:hypothetical protein